MIPELEKYKSRGHFLFKPIDNIRYICNAPKDKAGVYVVYTLKNNRNQLVYIGRSGKKLSDGSLFIRQGGIFDRLVNGKRDGELRRNYWIREMVKDHIDALEIFWYVTHDEQYADCPGIIEDDLIKVYKPLWNR